MASSTQILIGTIAIAIAGWYLAQQYNNYAVNLDPIIWYRPFELPSLSGVLEPNSILAPSQKAEQGECTAPESIAFDSREHSGYAYASLNDGRVVVLDKLGTYHSTLYFNGSLIRDLDDGMQNEGLLWCQRESRAGRLAWAQPTESNEMKCGRPLGLRIRSVSRVTGSLHKLIDG